MSALRPTLRGRGLRSRATWALRRAVPRYLVVPSSGPSLRDGKRVRLLALLAVRDEMRFLPGFFANVAPHVDGVIALDDGSRDGSAEFLAQRPEVLELIRISPDRPRWDEVGNHRALVAAAIRHGGEWAICLDADERVERDFRARTARVIWRGRLLGLTAYRVRIRELWSSTDRFRCDRAWDRKRPPRLFRLRPDHAFDDRMLHGGKAPLQARQPLGSFPLADLEVYHLRMVRPEDREARRRRYQELDPEGRWQRGGYA